MMDKFTSEVLHTAGKIKQRGKRERRMSLTKITYLMARYSTLARGMLVLTIAYTSSCSTMYARATLDFNAYPDNVQISYEPGTEDAANEVAEGLDGYIENIEVSQFGPFKDPSKIRVFIFNDKKRYARFSNTNESKFGGASTNEAYISMARIRERQSSDLCQVRECPETLESVLLHELSHIHLRQYLGSWKYISDVPSWFHEGMATSVAGGAGGGAVSIDEARNLILSGSHFLPEDSGVIFSKPGTRGDIRPGTFQFYKQSQMFVEYLMSKNPEGFANAINELRSGKQFRSVWEPNYNRKISDLWKDFEISL